MTRRSYRNPPVHEVILDLRFKSGIPPQALEAVPAQLPQGLWGVPTRQSEVTLQGPIGPGKTGFQADSIFVGWEFSVAERRWVTRLARDRFALHAVRHGEWPYGDYAGWEEIRDRYERLLPDAVGFFGENELKRIGLRYVNRVVVPTKTDINAWFTVIPTWPSVLDDQELLTFTQHGAFVSVKGHEHMSASVRLGRASFTEDLPSGHVGLLLDIDIFNYRVANAPPVEQALDWFEEAHEVENQVFEGCISDELRALFDEVPS